MPQFRTKARAVDLLGKGQIADLPTAISELWKNGYDAYGDKLEASLYMKGYDRFQDSIFVISDDGKGMDEQDILDKWFVLGTDSKSRGEEDKKGPDSTLDKKPRVKMGEKGIGRLAVAYLGPQMLMLTKKRKKPLEMVFFDWRTLENFDLFLSDINIPIQSVESTKTFKHSFSKLKEEFLSNFSSVRKKTDDPWKDQENLKKAIIEDCKLLEIPDFLIENCVSDMLKDGVNAHGTRFVIFQPDPQIVELKNFAKKDGSEDSSDDISFHYTISSLAGLFNTFKNKAPECSTNFWIYETSDTSRYDLLTHRAFFVPEDFRDCDHQIEGSFDLNGEFEGSVRIYNKSVKHKFTPQRRRGTSTYGPFNLKIGYVNALEAESMLKGERKRVLEDKLSLYGGLFIYRDGIRVLPYGRIDNDFLEFEERRSKGAGTYFFAKRRMFGYIEITREVNDKLKDKSSREGFINNQAFRDFKVDLISFFKDLAKKYFATKAEYSYKEEQQENLKEQAEAERQEHEKDKQARKDFAKALSEMPKELESLHNEFIKSVNELKSKNLQLVNSYDQVQNIISNIESCKVRIAQFKMTRPVRFKPTDLQLKKFNAYKKTYSSVLSEFQNSDEILAPIRDRLKVHELFKEFQDKVAYYRNTIARYYQNYEAGLDKAFAKIRSEFLDEKQSYLDDFNDKSSSIVPEKTSVKEISRSTKLLDTIFSEAQESIKKRIEPYLSHLERLSFDVNEDNLVGYYKERFEAIKEEWNRTYELAQLGIAVEIIDHQFNTLYAQMSESIDSIKPLLQEKSSQRHFRHLNNAFNHLQDNYKLLQPLYRTTGRIRKEISGLELKNYTEEFFGNRLKENDIEYNITERGKKWMVNSYESVFKPALINIINNAIYWLQRSETKEIRLDARGESLLIMNSGESIDDTILEHIFQLFYSERPKGRGIGLYLAKQSLNGIGFDICATNEPSYNILKGACFIIKPLKNGH